MVLVESQPQTELQIPESPLANLELLLSQIIKGYAFKKIDMILVNKLINFFDQNSIDQLIRHNEIAVQHITAMNILLMDLHHNFESHVLCENFSSPEISRVKAHLSAIISNLRSIVVTLIVT